MFYHVLEGRQQQNIHSLMEAVELSLEIFGMGVGNCIVIISRSKWKDERTCVSPQKKHQGTESSDVTSWQVYLDKSIKDCLRTTRFPDLSHIVTGMSLKERVLNLGCRGHHSCLKCEVILLYKALQKGQYLKLEMHFLAFSIFYNIFSIVLVLSLVIFESRLLTNAYNLNHVILTGRA